MVEIYRLPTYKPCLSVGSPLLQKEEYHTHLAVLYLEEVLQQRAAASSQGSEPSETQTKLRRLLQKSDLYRVHSLIGEDEHSVLPSYTLLSRGGDRDQLWQSSLLILWHDSLGPF